MTEHSYYHDGVTQGDAIEAPYPADLYTEINSVLRSSGDAFVFPFDQNELLVAHTGVAVTVDTGSAWIGGVYYNNSALVTLSLITNTSAYNRIDRVIIRVNWATQTAVLAIKTGAPSAFPTPPDLVQEIGSVYEFPLARFYAGLGANYLIDEREFANTALHANRYTNDNIFPNSEFMSLPRTGALATSPSYVPAYWEYAANAECDLGIKFDQMSRGQTLEVTLPATPGDYINCDMRLLNASVATVPVTIRMWIEVTAGAVSIVELASGTTLTTIPVTAGAVEVILRPLVFIAANPTMQLQFVGAVANTSFNLGQITLAYGKIGAPLVPRHEFILFGRGYQQVLPTLSAGSNIVDLDVVFGTRSLIAALTISDTNSSGTASVYAAIQNVVGAANQLRVEIGRAVNSASTRHVGMINFEYDPTLPYIYYNSTYQIDFKVAWSLLANFASYLYYVGMQT